MLDPAHLLTASATVERVLWGFAGVVTIVLAVRALRAHRGAATLRLEIGRRAERLAMGVILLFVLVTRLVAAASPQQPQVYFPQASLVFIASYLQAGDLGRRWLAQFRNAQVLSEHESPFQAPVAAALQWLLGISIELPTIDGAVWAVLAVLLAWRVGRLIEGRAFGVLFAALLAVSPLQLAWARIGGVHIGAPPAVLLALWAGWLAGRRGSAVRAFLSGIVAWSCVYWYFAARVGMVLVFVALWAGWWRSWRTKATLVRLVAAAAAGLAACALAHRAANPGQMVWPSVVSYVGSSGEVTIGDWVASATAAVREQLPEAVRAYFWRKRLGEHVDRAPAAASPWTGTLRAPGMAHGGLVLIPVLALGAIGVVRCLRHPIERALWLALAVGGALPPIIAPPTARRLLVFDVAWCAFAAFGMLSLLESRPLAPASGSARWRWGGLVLAAIGVWSATAVALSWAILPSQHTQIPFAESGFGDETTCLGCIATARARQREIEDGRMVVLFDSDLYRENATSPGALPLYGKTVAMAAGHPDRFLAYYKIVSNQDWLPPRPGRIASAPPDDAAAAVAARIEAAKPDAIVWWFSEPNAWERRVIEALVGAGSTRTALPPRPVWGGERTSASGDPVRVDTPWERRHDVFAALRRLIDPPSPATCIRLVRVGTHVYREPPLVLAPVVQGGEGSPQWAMGTWRTAEIFGTFRPSGYPQALVYYEEANGRPVAAVVDSNGTSRLWTPGGEERPGGTVPGPRPLGRDCLALHERQWWVVDPVAGELHVPGAPVAAAPSDAIGITRLGDRMVLASADQRLHVVDPVARRVERSFPAMVVPGHRLHFGECALLAAGDG